MNKPYRLIKRYIALILVLLFSIESFAAVVGDNDGAAFITKAEFDSLKNDFQSQLDRYNSSLDNKIDGAIAAYLSGVAVAKETNIEPIVSNYKDMYWVNDLFLKLNKRTWQTTTSYTETGMKWQKPTFANYRNLRAGRFYYSAIYYVDIVTFLFTWNLQVKADAPERYWNDSEGWHSIIAGSSDGYDVNFTDMTAPWLFRCYDLQAGKPKLINDGSVPFGFESQMNDRGYPGQVVSTDGTHLTPLYQNINRYSGPGPDGGYVVLPKNTTDVARFKVKFHNYNGAESTNTPGATTYETEVLYLPSNKNSYGSPSLKAGLLGPDYAGYTKLRNTTFTFANPAITQDSPSHAQVNADYNVLKNIFLGAQTDTKVNCAVELSTQGPTAWGNYDYTHSEIKTVTFDPTLSYFTISRSNLNNRTYPFIDESGASVQPEWGMPIWPQYYLREIYNPKFQTKNKIPLQIGGGLPIADTFFNDGKLNVKIKYKVYDNDVTVTADPSQSIRLSFKKSDYNDTTTNNYLADDSGTILRDVLWEPTTTDTTYSVIIPVKKGDSTWLRIGPKETNASGHYVRITDMNVKLVTE